MRVMAVIALLLLAAAAAQAASGDDVALAARLKLWAAATEPRTTSLQKASPQEVDRIVEALRGTCTVLTNGDLIQYRVPVAESNREGNVGYRAWVLQDDRDVMRQHNLRGFNTTVSQAAPDGGAGLIEEFNILLVGRGQWKTGDPVRGLGLEDGTFEYTTTDGAQRRVPKYQWLPTRDLTRSQLSELCKAGRKFKVLLPVRLTCPYCGGLGNLRGPNHVDRLPCERCRSSGKLESPVPVTVGW